MPRVTLSAERGRMGDHDHTIMIMLFIILFQPEKRTELRSIYLQEVQTFVNGFVGPSGQRSIPIC